MKTELRWVILNVFQVPSKSIPNTAVGDRLIWEDQLAKALPLEMGLKMRSRELGGMWNLSKYLPDQTNGTCGARHAAEK